MDLTLEIGFIFALLIAVLALFIWGRWRYDVVALLALLAVAILGLVSPEDAFSGFGHPAVITVAAVLVISRGLINSGAIGALSRWVSRIGKETTVQILTLTLIVCVLSAFINNVGALAIMMPVAIRMARKCDKSPAIFLMPLAFGSMLGGLTTLIGTPPNIIVATFRADFTGEAFKIFDFTPVGMAIAFVGVVFISFLGWRLIPPRKEGEVIAKAKDYIAEVRVPEGSKVIGKNIIELQRLSDADGTVVTLMRGNSRISLPPGHLTIKEGDVLVVRDDPQDLKSLMDASGLELLGDETSDEDLEEDALKSEEVTVIEVVVESNSIMIGRTAKQLALHDRYGVNVIGISREGRVIGSRLLRTSFKAGDVLLIQGPINSLPEILEEIGCLPLAERPIELTQPRREVMALAMMGVPLLLIILGYMSVQIGFTLAAVAMVMVGLVPLRDAYKNVDWPIIILLGAMIPLGQALENTGGARFLAEGLLSLAGTSTPWVAMAIVLIVTMLLSNVVNNAATAVLMLPIAITIATELGTSLDPFLMAIAVGASSAFLTPIGHQSATLVMGPGGYHFGDYWRLGLPLEIIMIVIALPLIMVIWPF
jgi:di/tricarboxylate transporter